MKLKLDNSAVLHTALMNDENINIFRISVTLKEKVDPYLLQEALDSTIPRFPSIAGFVSNNTYWYFAESLSYLPVQEDNFILRSIRKQDIGQTALKVLYKGNSISVEVFHSMTDGYGCLVFVKTLVANYIAGKMKIPSHFEEENIPSVDQSYTEKEIEDSFFAVAEKGLGQSFSKQRRKTFKFASEYESREIKVTTFSLDIAEVKMIAKRIGCSVNDLLAGIFAKSIMNYQENCTSNHADKLPIELAIPVNLRNIFESETLRNFTLPATPKITARDSCPSLYTIIKCIQYQMKQEFLAMKGKISANTALQKSCMIRIFPLRIKNWLIKLGFKVFGESSCLTISNLGLVGFPNEIESRIEEMNFALSPRYSTPYNCGVISFKNKLHINLTRNCEEAILEKYLFEQLSKLVNSLSVKEMKAN